MGLCADYKAKTVGTGCRSLLCVFVFRYVGCYAVFTSLLSIPTMLIFTGKTSCPFPLILRVVPCSDVSFLWWLLHRCSDHLTPIGVYILLPMVLVDQFHHRTVPSYFLWYLLPSPTTLYAHAVHPSFSCTYNWGGNSQKIERHSSVVKLIHQHHWKKYINTNRCQVITPSMQQPPQEGSTTTGDDAEYEGQGAGCNTSKNTHGRNW